MKKLPKLCFVGPMIGRNPGCVTTQGEILADHFASAGYPTISVSGAANRYVRLYDIVKTLLLNHREIDIQCLQVYGGPSFVVEDIASRLGRLFGQRQIMVLRGGGMPEFMARYPRWSCQVLSRADMIVTPSKFLARAVRRFGFTARVIPNIIDVARYPYNHRKQLHARLFWMRSFHPVYNPEMAVRVLAQVRTHIKDATLVIAGQDKGSGSNLNALANKLGLAHAVSFPGYLNLADKLREGCATDIFLNTNRVDNMPVSVIEACAMGLPVVATNVGGIPDLLTDSVTGLLVPDDDDKAMTAAIMRLLKNPSLAGRLSANGRKLAESFSWEQIRPRWDHLFETVMNEPARNEEAVV